MALIDNPAAFRSTDAADSTTDLPLGEVIYLDDVNALRVVGPTSIITFDQTDITVPTILTFGDAVYAIWHSQLAMNFNTLYAQCEPGSTCELTVLRDGLQIGINNVAIGDTKSTIVPSSQSVGAGQVLTATLANHTASITYLTLQGVYT